MFETLRKEIGSINPDTLQDVLDGKTKLSLQAHKEFKSFMERGAKMFAPATPDQLEERAKRRAQWDKEGIVLLQTSVER